MNRGKYNNNDQGVNITMTRGKYSDNQTRGIPADLLAVVGG